mgnify:CR=1 FL=1
MVDDNTANSTAVESFIQRDKVITIIAIAILVGATFTYTVLGVGMNMSAIQMTPGLGQSQMSMPNMSAMRNDLLCLFVVCGLAACADSNSAGSGEPGFSAVSGAYVATTDPGTCGLWTTVTPPEDFDAICRGGGEDLQALELSMWEMVNADRVEHNEEANGAAPVGYDCAVAEVARIHSYDQCKAAQLAHELNGKTPGDRLEHYLQLSFGADFFTYGENVAWYPDHYVQSTLCHPMELLAAMIRDRGYGSSRIGVELENYYFSAKAFLQLQTHLPNAKFSDATALVNWQRAIKSDEEIGFMRFAPWPALYFRIVPQVVPPPWVKVGAP